MDSILQLYMVWIVAGVILMVGYAYLGASFVFWVAGGLTVAALLPVQLPDLSDTTQATVWILAASLYLLAWFVLFKPPGAAKKRSEVSKQVFIGESGKLIKSSGKSDRMMIKLSYSINGSSKWPIIPLGEMEAGDQVVVVDTVGQSLVVKKSDPQAGELPDS